ncbi:hypothetical protein J26TS2_04370 [Shouchella clausii]|uniref:hypothetical protein n=1 Tax=Shouchella tritolerans TaxID=2979466 RepID=UPI001B29B9C1|nr:hypothetical protein [Shouchella tritolerans]GIN10570.1 hypothetical protein J26TS2_04370 [Shouchella clausii]
MKRLGKFGVLLTVCMLFGMMLGVQLMSEHAGLSETKPLELNKEEPVKEMPAPTPTPAVADTEFTGATNFFSELGLTLASGAESAARSGLEGLMTAVRNGINKESERHDESAESSY